MKSITYEQMTGTDVKPVSEWWRISAIPMGVLMTCALLYSMQHLIKTDFPEAVDKPTLTIPDFKMDIPTDIDVQESELPQKPELIERPETMEFVEPVIASVDPKIITLPPVDTKIKINPDQGAAIGGQLMPIVRINPNYPASAASRNIEGYVDVMFDITPIGATTNIRIVGYSPSTVFNASVIKAVRGWKYRAAADEEGARMTLDVKERISFVLEK